MSRPIRKVALKNENFYYESDYSESGKDDVDNSTAENTNSIPTQDKPEQTTSTIIGNNKKIATEISGSDSESNSETNSSDFDPEDTSSSEFDPDNKVLPKRKVKNLKNSCQTANTKIIKQSEVEKKNFIASLSNNVPLEEADSEAVIYRIKYKSMKEDLCKNLYKLFNEKIFSNQLPNDIPFEWNSRLRIKGGLCQFSKATNMYKIFLSTKVVDSPCRLRDILIHEMCHVATMKINNIFINNYHGTVWKAWANEAMKVFPELVPISQYYHWKIFKKYTYKCTSCGKIIERHSKSIDLNRNCCGICHGTFELIVNKVTKDGTVQQKSADYNKLSGFALYVKQNYRLVKQNNPSDIKHGEVMKILSQKFSDIKLTSKSADKDAT